jgi:hypothetical protein
MLWTSFIVLLSPATPGMKDLKVLQWLGSRLQSSGMWHIMVWYVGISFCTLELEVEGSCEMVASLYQSAWNHTTSCSSCSSLNVLYVSSYHPICPWLPNLVLTLSYFHAFGHDRCLSQHGCCALLHGQIEIWQSVYRLCDVGYSEQCAFFWLLCSLHRESVIPRVTAQLVQNCVYVNRCCVYVNWGALACGWSMQSGFFPHEKATVKCSTITVN